MSTLQRTLGMLRGIPYSGSHGCFLQNALIPCNYTINQVFTSSLAANIQHHVETWSAAACLKLPFSRSPLLWPAGLGWNSNEEKGGRGGGHVSSEASLHRRLLNTMSGEEWLPTEEDPEKENNRRTWEGRVHGARGVRAELRWRFPWVECLGKLIVWFYNMWLYQHCWALKS